MRHLAKENTMAKQAKKKKAVKATKKKKISLLKWQQESPNLIPQEGFNTAEDDKGSKPLDTPVE